MDITARIGSIENALTAEFANVNKDIGRLEQIEKDIKEFNDSLISLKVEYDNLESVNILLSTLSKITMQSVKANVDNLVTESLQSIYDGDKRRKFEAEFCRKRNRSYVKFNVTDIVEDTVYKGEINESRGNGVNN